MAELPDLVVMNEHPGIGFLQADLSQAELRIAASLAFEDTMLAVYNADGDIHKTTGLRIASKYALALYEKAEGDEKKKLLKDMRQKAKAANFGLIYGGSFLVLQRIAKQDYNVIISEDEAREVHRVFFALYPNLVSWHESVEAFVREHGYVVSPFGRVRHLPDIKKFYPDTREYSEIVRQALNSPVQGACADFLGQVWAYSAKEVRKRKLPARVVLTVHDSLVWEGYSKVFGELREIQNNAVKELNDFHMGRWLGCPMKLDYSEGPHWGDLEE
jgi:DNA polymerase-1